jgi:cyanophycinase-like exopeptidase
MFRHLLLAGILFLNSIQSFSQPGRLLLVGGGNEKNESSGWSTPAYRWAGQGKKVAIIGTSTGTLASYFMQYCGAERAKEFAIDSYDSANSQATYDTLTSYDVIFFRGGDQWEYYNLYKNTKLLDAVNHVYNEGGTICGTSAGLHILSSVVYTAEFGSAYSSECIENPNNHFVTLEDDFLNFVPGYVFDSHVAERGRFGRTVGFLANYSLNKSLWISALAMDDRTCMTVDENGTGTVYGTGCANIYRASGSNTFSQNGLKLLADTVNVTQLLHGCTYNFASGQSNYAGLNRQLNSSVQQETGNYTILASGGNSLNDNMAMLTDFVTNSGELNSPILLLSGNEEQAILYKDKIMQLGAPEVNYFRIDASAGTNADLAHKTDSATKIIFLLNNSATFSLFLDSPNGTLLKQKAGSEGMITAFVGDDARFAGRTVVENYLTLDASYYSELTFNKGIGLLHNTVIMPNTYLNSDVYENTCTAVPYVMAKDTLKYGIWLTRHNYMKYSPVEGKSILTGFGTAPVMVIANKGLLAGLSSHTSTGSPGTLPRMIAGFEHLQLSLIDYTTPYILGNIQSDGIQKFRQIKHAIILSNPVQNELSVKWETRECEWEIIDLNCKVLIHGKALGEKELIDVTRLIPGIYLFKITGKFAERETCIKFVKE